MIHREEGPTQSATLGQPPTNLWPTLTTIHAALVVLAWMVAVSAVSARWHSTPLYGVETDLVGEYLPAARELMAGDLNLSRYSFKGPGYPLILALLAAPLGGDVALVARFLSPVMMGLAALAAFLLIRHLLGGAVATFSLAALLCNPTIVRYAIEVGTDAPALALMMWSTLLVIRGGPVELLAAGAIGAYAVLMRSNAAFLMPCAALTLFLRERRTLKLLAYVIGAALPLSAWAWVTAKAGGMPPDRNYLNVAWELYGHGVPWDRFESTIGAQFNSMLDVLRYDPLAAALRVAWNALYYRLLDARDLVGPFLAALALPGVVLLILDQRARLWLCHVGACALVLAPVFYNPRFALYLLPAYAAGAGLSLAWIVKRLRAADRFSGWPRAAAATVTCTAVVLLGSLGSAVKETVASLASAPHETRVAGHALRQRGVFGERILARKPHVAHFAGLESIPLPTDVPLWRLPSWARGAGANYLFFSGIEQVMRPNYSVLSDSGVSLPGFDQILWRQIDPTRFFAVYRLQESESDSAAFADMYRAALVRYEARHTQSGASRLFVAAQLIELGLPAEALQRLDRLERAGARDPAVSKLRSVSLLQLGNLDGAAEACLTSMSLAPPTAWHWSHLGEIRSRQRNLREAHRCFERAVQIEPASVPYLRQLGLCKIDLKDYGGAAVVFERCLKLSPSDVQVRRFAMGAWDLAGNRGRVRELFSQGVQAGIAPAALLSGSSAER